MKFPIETIAMPSGCVAQEARYGGRTSPRKVGVPRIKGRPQIIYEGQRWLSARLSYHLNISCIDPYPDLKSDQLVLHSCDNGWCIAPGHLRLGTQTENMIDKSARNENYRATRGKFSEDALRRIGEASARRKGEKRKDGFWQTEQGRAKAGEASKSRWNNKEKREATIKGMKERAASEEGRKKILAAQRARWDKEGSREKASLKLKKRWEDKRSTVSC
jgi:hypothetical protein